MKGLLRKLEYAAVGGVLAYGFANTLWQAALLAWAVLRPLVRAN